MKQRRVKPAHQAAVARLTGAPDYVLAECCLASVFLRRLPGSRVTRVEVHHDDGCDALLPGAAGASARTSAALAVHREMSA